ncbi:MAG TPA: hypothetical protein VMI31_16170 [Fimbriimonadaceae bacterium]|nr:hypothetical protein [Fimbriimonadaceae bacterium]
MRRLIAIGVAAGLAGWVIAQVSGTDMLAGYAKSLNSAKSLSATLTIQKVMGGSYTETVDLAKPNKARIDTPTQLVVADGTTITTYDKKANTFFKKPETDADLKAQFTPDELSMFGPFFDAGFFKDKVVTSKAAGQKTFKGTSYNVVLANLDNKNKKTVSFYLDPNDKLAKVGEYVLNDAGVTDTMLVMAKNYSVDGTQKDDTFAFVAPDGAHELTAEEMNAGKWYENLADAEAAAKATNRPILVDFYADW